ncbi:hypothetical protein ACIBI9_39230 [Nonomuraea sp. NPDC050451]|uniref:hypothetical protein n=1 Tax=Nonomuraea sp. NPDC050451 TaxID=3364364 RepID=UPI003789C800
MLGGPLMFLSTRGARSLAERCTRDERLVLLLVATFLACRLFGYGLRQTSARAEPAVAAVLGVVVAGVRLPALSWCGPAVLAGGLAVLAFPAGVRR